MADKTGGFSSGVIEGLLSIEPEEELVERSLISLARGDGEVLYVKIEDGKAWLSDRNGDVRGEAVDLGAERSRMYGNTTPWMILGQLARLSPRLLTATNIGFSTAAWKLAPRDNFIGWTRHLREKNLPFVVDNPRFLILPWIKIPNLGSHILAIIRRRLPDDWTERYNTTPVLIETFVETPRYTGAVYRASGWTRVGTTQGRGRYDRDRQSDKPKKDVWLRPLRRDWKRTLNR